MSKMWDDTLSEDENIQRWCDRMERDYKRRIKEPRKDSETISETRQQEGLEA